MTLDDFTIKAQDAINKAQSIAKGFDQQMVDIQHLVKGLLEVDHSIVEFILKKMALDENKIKEGIDQMVWDSPKSTTAAKQKLSKAANLALAQAKKMLTAFGDTYISNDLILIGILNTKTPAADFLRKQGLTAK